LPTTAAWIANHALRLYRLRASGLFELRATYGLLTSDRLFAQLCASFAVIVMGALAFAAGYIVLALLACSMGVLLARYLFFVSVVPLKMGLTFLQGRHA